MHANEASLPFICALVVLAFLSSVSALTTPYSAEADPSSFEMTALL
jgi:hypothetical protein